MSGMSRSSVASLPGTGNVMTTSIVADSKTPVAGPTANSGEVWKIIGVTITAPAFPAGAITGNFDLTNTNNSNVIAITDSADYGGGPQTAYPIEISKYIAGELLLDDKTRLSFTETGDGSGASCQVAYVIVN